MVSVVLSVQVVHPNFTVPQVQRSVTTGFAGSEFGHEDSEFSGHLPVHVSHLVGGCVVVECVHDVVIGERVHGVKILGPGGSSDDDDSVRVVVSDDGNDSVGVGFNFVPADTVGLIADFVENMVLGAVGLAHVVPEIGGARVVSVIWVSGVQDVPVDDHINSQVGSPVNELVDSASPVVGVLVVPSFCDVHCNSDDTGTPLVHDGGE